MHPRGYARRGQFQAPRIDILTGCLPAASCPCLRLPVGGRCPPAMGALAQQRLLDCFLEPLAAQATPPAISGFSVFFLTSFSGRAGCESPFTLQYSDGCGKNASCGRTNTAYPHGYAPTPTIQKHRMLLIIFLRPRWARYVSRTARRALCRGGRQKPREGAIRWRGCTLSGVPAPPRAAVTHKSTQEGRDANGSHASGSVCRNIFHQCTFSSSFLIKTIFLAGYI